VAFTVATRDPDGPQSVGLVVAGSGLASGALAAVVLVSLAMRGTRRGARRGAAVARGLRRGVMAGCAIALVALLRVLDGLSPLTVTFVVTPFVVAEIVVSTRRG
jgi:hypothetical protein